MRLEILFLAALAALASAAPQWPYRDAVAPYYYGYPGKTPYMYRSGDEDDERDETYLARQDLKVAAGTDAGSSVTVVEDDEKADGVRVVETGSAKPVAQSGNNNIQLQNQDQVAAPAASQAQQPHGNNNPNANNVQPAPNGQPLTVQQPGQQPPAFPPAARPTNRPRPAEEEDEDEEEDDSEEDEEDAEDEEEGDDEEDDDEDEEDDEDRKRNDVAQKEASSEEPQQVVQEPLPVQPQSSIVNSEGSDEVQEEQQPAEQPQQQSQSAVLNNKVSKNKQNAVLQGKNKKVVAATNTKLKNPGAIEALVPGYVTDQGEVLVPVDTVTGSQPITIVPDPFSPPSRIVGGPRPIPQSAVPSAPNRQIPFWYRNSPNVNPLAQEGSPLGRQTLYSPIPPPGSIFTFDDDDDDDDDVIPGNRLRQEADDDDDDEQDEESEENEEKVKPPPQKVPLAAIPASGNSGEDDEAEALAFVNSGRPVSIRRPVATAVTGNKKPAAGTAAATGAAQATSNESDSEEDVEESEEDDVNSQEEEEDDNARRVATPAQLAAVPNNKGRMYVDEDYVSFPPSRSPAIFAVLQGRFPQAQRPQSQVFSSPSPNNPYQRYVVRVTPANRPRPQQPIYYRPYESATPNKRVVPIASFDVSVEDTAPSRPSSPISIDSDEDGESIIASGPTPVTSFPFVYKVQGSLQSIRPGGGGRPSGIRPPRPSIQHYGGGPNPNRPPRPYGSQGSFSRPPYASIAASLYSPYGPLGQFGPGPYGPPRPPSGISGGPPVIVRRKQPGGRPDRPPKPQLIAVYNPTGQSSSGPGGPRPREPVEEEYYTFEVPETNNKLVPGGRPPNKRPTVHRRPTPVIHQKQASEDEEESDETLVSTGPPSSPHQIQIIPQGTVRRIRGGKQLKPKKNSKKTTSSTKKQQQNDQQDPLGLLSKINKSNKSKLH